MGDHEGFSPFVAMCFTVNYIMGTGFLTLPWAFNSAGIGLSFICLGAMCWVSDVSKNYVLEVMGRAEQLFGGDKGNSGTVDEVDEEDCLIGGSAGDGNGGYGATKIAVTQGEDTPSKKKAPTCVGTRNFELVELCSLFLGKTGSNLYMGTLGLYMYGTLWAYTSVFAKACAEAVPLGKMLNLGDDDYLIWVFVFASIVIPLTCMELREQIAIQVLLSICRGLMVLFVVGSTLLALSSPENSAQFGEVGGGSHYDGRYFKWAGLHKMLPITVFANIYHHSIPGLSAPVGDKTKLGWIFGLVFVFGFFAYTSIGSVVAYYFGDSIEQSANMNWSSFHANTGWRNAEDGEWEGKAWWVNVIALYVIIFPATDVVSAFPLNGITLGNNLMMQTLGGEDKASEDKASEDKASEGKAGEGKASPPDRSTKTLFRILGCVPPIIGACFVRDLGKITDYTGITGFALAFIFPGLLWIASRRATMERGFDGTTIYEMNAMSTEFAAFGIVIFGCILVVFVFGSLTFSKE